MCVLLCDLYEEINILILKKETHSPGPLSFLPGLGLEKHPPMVGPRIEGQPGKEGGRGRMEVREGRSDQWAGLFGRWVTQSRGCQNLQVQAGHRTRQLLHVI